jgi:U4/U6 small nuclear ribonucleoprotein SNU13
MADEDVYEQLLNLIQQACQAGQLKKDATESTMSVNNGIAELVIVANDAPLVVILRHLRILCRYKKVHCVSVACRLALGRACGVDDPVSACSIIKDGDEAGEDVVNKQVKILVEKLLRYQE